MRLDVDDPVETRSAPLDDAELDGVRCHVRERMVSICHAVVNREKVAPLEFDDITERGEAFTTEWLNYHGFSHRSCPAGVLGSGHRQEKC